MNLQPSHAVGEVLADELARVLGGDGKVVLIGRAGSRQQPEAKGAQLASLEAVLRRRGSPQLAATEWLPKPPPASMDSGGISAEQLLGFFIRNKDANAFVIFAGLPGLSPDLAADISARSIKLLAVCGYSPNVRNWLTSRALVAAVVPRWDDLSVGAAAPQKPADWFQREFQLLTPENVPP